MAPIERYSNLRSTFFIEGRSFLDDLAFSYYFHSTPQNQFIHSIFFFPLAFTILSIAFKIFESNVLLYAIILLYLVPHIWLNFVVAVSKRKIIQNNKHSQKNWFDSDSIRIWICHLLQSFNSFDANMV